MPHAFANAVEEVAREVRVAPFAPASILVESPHGVPFGGPDLRPAKCAELQPFASLGSFLADGLALAAGQGSEKSVERGIAPIKPMILNALADQPRAALTFERPRIVNECDVGGRDLVLDRHRLKRGEQLLRSRTEQ